MSNVTIRPANIDEVETLQNLNNDVFVDNVKYDDDLQMDWYILKMEVKNILLIYLMTANQFVCLRKLRGRPLDTLPLLSKRLVTATQSRARLRCVP